MDPNGLSINANALGSPSNSPPSSPRLAAVPSPASADAVVMHVANSLLSDLSENAPSQVMQPSPIVSAVHVTNSLLSDLSETQAQVMQPSPSVSAPSLAQGRLREMSEIEEAMEAMQVQRRVARLGEMNEMVREMRSEMRSSFSPITQPSRFISGLFTQPPSLFRQPSTHPLEAATQEQEYPALRQRWERQEIARILGDVHRWSTDQNVNPDIQKARARIWETLSSQMTAWGLNGSTTGILVLQGNILPTFIFREKFIQDKLTELTIACQEKDATNDSGTLELQGIENLKNLTDLMIKGVGIKQILGLSESIKNLTALTRLSIRDTSISQLPESIGYLSNLQELSLFYNKNLIRLPGSLVRLCNLRELSLTGCMALRNLPDTSPDPFAITDTSYRFGNLRALQSLDLTDCRALKKLPQSICELRHLENLCLVFCMALEKLPECMDALGNLQELDFWETKIESLPVSLYRLALNKPPSFLPFPWDATVQWMRTAQELTIRQSQNPSPPYIVTDNTLRIEMRRDTAVPFATGTLKLAHWRIRTGRSSLTSSHGGICDIWGGRRANRWRRIKKRLFLSYFLELCTANKRECGPYFGVP